MAGSEIAMCMLGSIRTFERDCVAKTTLTRIAVPLQADVYAFVNVPKEYRLAQRVRVQALVEDTINSVTSHAVKIAAVDYNSNHRLPGRAQVAGFRKCWNYTKNRGYLWIVRVRTDTYHAFTLTSLPRSIDVPIAIVSYLGLQQCVGDQFAILGGRQAQEAYFHHGANALSNVKYDRHAPECAIGHALADHNIKTYDMRKLINKTDDGREVALNIVRNSCDTVTEGKGWITPVNAAPIEVTGKDIASALKLRRTTPSEQLPLVMKIVSRVWDTR